ncbi:MULTISPECIES: AbrB/MazE/SpoVT family DNA-binding domain-containing protein [unclassified Metabacillus]|uniref:AbrB/MazE/SpoVT family DNA-binding domain-containing protein n=1 Tax=Metabacillus sp. JX24 TaxID=3240759 RepID=UPI0030FDB35C
MRTQTVLRKMDSEGRVTLPQKWRKYLGIKRYDHVEIFADHHSITIRKFEPQKKCFITGKIDPDNFVCCDGKVVLSPEGVDILKNRLAGSTSFMIRP